MTLVSIHLRTKLFNLMIRNFHHSGLRQLFEKGERKKLNPMHLDKIRRILARLNESSRASDMDLPGYRLHPLKGSMDGFWSVTVQANWRIVFRMQNGDVFDVDYLDYH